MNRTDAKNINTEVCLNDFILLYHKLKKRQGIFWVSLQGLQFLSFALRKQKTSVYSMAALNSYIIKNRKETIGIGWSNFAMLGIPYQSTEIIFRLAVSDAENGASRLYFYTYCCSRLPASLVFQCTLFALKVYQIFKIIQEHFCVSMPKLTMNNEKKQSSLKTSDHIICF